MKYLFMFCFAASLSSFFFCIPESRQTQPPMSVHEMFKEIPQDQLLEMMAEGERFIKDLEENGTEEEKRAFALAMEDTLKSFTEDDWKEFNEIVNVVEQAMPPMPPVEIQPKREIIKETPKVLAAPVKESSPIAEDNSFEKTLHTIYKHIKSVLLKAKSDTVLLERISMDWNKKDDFNEMTRLLQLLNKKEHIARINDTKNEEAKSLLESIQNFGKRLAIEDTKFIIADTFGLQVDEKTSNENLKKLNVILDFFETAVDSLLPKLIKFIQEFEPEALKIAQEHDAQAKSALDYSSKIEKQKRPATPYQPQPRARDNNPTHKNRAGHYDAYSHGNYTPDYRPQHGPHDNPAAHNDPTKSKNEAPKITPAQDPKSEKTPDKNNDATKTPYQNAVNQLDGYFDMFSNEENNSLLRSLKNLDKIYDSFNKEISIPSHIKKYIGTDKQYGPLTESESKDLAKYEEQIAQAQANFGTNVKKAHEYYDTLKESFNTVSLQIDEMISVCNAVKNALESMNAEELNKINESKSLHMIKSRLNAIDKEWESIQRRLIKIHEDQTLANLNPAELRQFELLAEKIKSIHGLDQKIEKTKTAFNLLNKAIKKEIGKRKRQENKGA
jgi:hypothetical protein